MVFCWSWGYFHQILLPLKNKNKSKSKSKSKSKLQNTKLRHIQDDMQLNIGNFFFFFKIIWSFKNRWPWWLGRRNTAELFHSYLWANRLARGWGTTYVSTIHERQKRAIVFRFSLSTVYLFSFFFFLFSFFFLFFFLFFFFSFFFFFFFFFFFLFFFLFFVLKLFFKFFFTFFCLQFLYL